MVQCLASSPLLVSTALADAGAELEAAPAASAVASARAASAACCEECPFRLKYILSADSSMPACWTFPECTRVKKCEYATYREKQGFI